MNEEERDDNYSRKSATILIVDDKENAVALLKRRLAIYGHEVITVPDYRKAMMALSSHAIDVIFLNMFIGDHDSYEFLQKLKEENLYKNIPVIMISSSDDTDLIVKCIEAGAEDYLVKPLNQTLLRARLANCVARKEAHDKELAYIAQIQKGQKTIQSQEKLASLGELVTSISNELKNPLNFVINFAQVSAEICDEIIAKINTEQSNISSEVGDFLLQQLNKFKSNVSKIYDYGHNADRIIRFMFDQANTQGGEKLPANINKIISHTITMLRSHLKSTGTTSLPKIETQLDEHIPHIAVSTQAISKAIYNLLRNSIESVLLKFENVDDSKIVIKTENQENSILISVYDNGVGISDSIKEKIFEAFFTTKHELGRQGLGLTTAQSIVLDHNAELKFHSVEGEYAEFSIIMQR